MARQPRPRPPGGLTRAPKRQRLGDRTDTVATSLVLPRSLHERLVLAGLKLNWTGSQVLRTAFEEFLTNHPEVTR
jgi:hypothetical protein